MDKYRAYVGSYTRGESKGIYMYDFNSEEAVFVAQGVEEITNPSFWPFLMTGNIYIPTVMKALQRLKYFPMEI